MNAAKPPRYLSMLAMTAALGAVLIPASRIEAAPAPQGIEIALPEGFAATLPGSWRAQDAGGRIEIEPPDRAEGEGYALSVASAGGVIEPSDPRIGSAFEANFGANAGWVRGPSGAPFRTPAGPGALWGWSAAAGNGQANCVRAFVVIAGGRMCSLVTVCGANIISRRAPEITFIATSLRWDPVEAGRPGAGGGALPRFGTDTPAGRWVREECYSSSGFSSITSVVMTLHPDGTISRSSSAAAGLQDTDSTGRRTGGPSNLVGGAARPVGRWFFRNGILELRFEDGSSAIWRAVITGTPGCRTLALRNPVGGKYIIWTENA